MPLASGISLWLIPSEPESALLQQLMSRHPKPSAPHSFPHFHPHVTLATIPLTPTPAPTLRPTPSDPAPPPAAPHEPEPEPDPTTLVLALREAIPLGQRALRLRFARVLAGDHYFRSIYTALVPSTELAQLRAAVAQAAGGGKQQGGSRRSAGPAPPAFPHLSLYYVADEEAHARVRLLQELEREGVVRHSADGLSVALRCVAGDGDGGGGGGASGDGVLEGFTGTQIWIVDCEGPVEGWKVLDKILLATSDC